MALTFRKRIGFYATLIVVSANAEIDMEYVRDHLMRVWQELDTLKTYASTPRDGERVAAEIIGPLCCAIAGITESRTHDPHELSHQQVGIILGEVDPQLRALEEIAPSRNTIAVSTLSEYLTKRLQDKPQTPHNTF